MPLDPFYRTRLWLNLRAFVLRRDHHRCTVPGCRARASTVDHVIARKAGGPDLPSNLRSLCTTHDRQVQEFRGKRKRDGQPVIPCNRDGMPEDPRHPWHRGG